MHVGRATLGGTVDLLDLIRLGIRQQLDLLGLLSGSLALGGGLLDLLLLLGGESFQLGLLLLGFLFANLLVADRVLDMLGKFWLAEKNASKSIHETLF